MAAPATHIVLAEKVFNKYFGGRDEKTFVVGTSFPDIRYLGVIDRDKTHFDVKNVGELDGLSDFMAGMKFHSLVDLVRETYMKDHGLYSLFPVSKFTSQGAKMFEDNILISKYDQWNKVKGYFDTIMTEELEFDVGEADIEKWHSFLRSFLDQQNVDSVSVHKFVEAIGRPTEMADEIVRVMEGVTDQTLAVAIIEGFYNDFERLIY